MAASAGASFFLFFKQMARLERFELPTPWFVAKYSIQLSYRRVMPVTAATLGLGFKVPM